MRKGKISENVLRRSVLKKIRIHRNEVKNGADVGTDCAVLSFGADCDVMLSTTPVSAPLKDISDYAVHMALNSVAAAGAEPVGVMLSILLPEETEESGLQYMMERAQAVCDICGADIIGGHTEVVPGITAPVMNVTGIGKRSTTQGYSLRGVGLDQDIIVSKWIGLEGTVRLARSCEEKLRARYPARMIGEAAAFDRYLSVIPEAAIALKSGVCGMHDVSRGGIFGALWEMAERAGVGLTVDLRKIPVKQETIEICEFFELNPYELLSGGCLLMTADNGEALTEALAAADIPAAVIGRTTDGHDRVIWNEDEKRYLDKPKADQIYSADELQQAWRACNGAVTETKSITETEE